MLQVRSNVFETNSSSTHSIALSSEILDKCNKEEALNSLLKIGAQCDDSVLNLSTIPREYWEFGWGPEIYNDFGHKLLYALLSYERDKIIFNSLLEYTVEFLKISSIILPLEYDKYDKRIRLIGDIDHESLRTLSQSLIDLEFENYLLNKNIFLVIDSEG